MSEEDSYLEKAKEICAEVSDNLQNIQSEEDAKIQIIVRILTDCLGWLHSDIAAETKHDIGYSDFILKDGECPVLLVEAKRIGLIDINSAEKHKVRNFKISGPSLKKAIAGIDQATSYAAPNGLPIAVLTDGISWIVFKTFTPGENFKSKEAIVFPSLSALLSDFSRFYDLLAKTQIQKKVYHSIFDEIHQDRILLTERLFSPIEDNDIHLSQKSELAFDLDKIFSSFFSKLSGEDSEDLLHECFVESKDSRIADFSLEKMTTSILGNLTPQNKTVDQELEGVIKKNVEAESTQPESGQTVFIIGPTGSGKSTFIDRFFKKTLSRKTRDKCILLSINCLDATGVEATAIDWITETIITKLEDTLYKNSSPEWNDLMGLYFAEYNRRRHGVDSQLYQRDKQAFREKFGDFLDKKVETDREGYLKRILEDVVKNRGMLPIILIDNTDEFSEEYKEKVFQFSQSLRRFTNHCLVIFPVTDKSAWSFSKTDIYGIYDSKSFFLPTPSPREVFRKRINFLKDKLIGDSHVKDSKNDYFSSRGIKISIENISGFAEVLEDIFVNHDYTSKTIGELTNYNIRRTLLLSQRVITSAEIKVDNLIKSFLVGKIVATSYNEFMDALIKGDYDAYKKNDNHEIYPIFQVDSNIRQSPLLKVRILALLNSLYKASTTIEERHMSVQSILGYFDAIGCGESSALKALERIFESGLVEAYDVSSKELSSKQKLAISHRGISHLRLASHNSSFFYQMALTTGITNEEIAQQIRGVYQSGKTVDRKVNEIGNLFFNYLLEEDKNHLSIAIDLDQYRCQEDLIDNIRSIVSSTSDSENQLVASHGENYKKGVVKTEVIVTVDWYDSHKGFGFAESEEMDARIFFHAEKLKENGIQSVSDGDGILCDISRNHKGLNIEKIHDVEEISNSSETTKCRIVRLFSERGYGFVRIGGTSREAFFYTSIFPQEQRESLDEGFDFTGEIVPDKKGRLSLVRRLIAEEATAALASD